VPAAWRTIAAGTAASTDRPFARASAAFALGLVVLSLLASCATKDTAHHVVISARDQKLAVLENGHLIATYPISTSKYGLGDARGSYRTPLGEMEVATKIGDGAALGAVFKDRRRTGEVVQVNAPGRDPIVTRIIWLRGRERQNANAFSRDIYIHGTPEERNIGRPASYGCIRMRSLDVISLYSLVGAGAQVTIVDQPLADLVPTSQTQTSSALVQLNRGAKNLR
jgi:lipoprotein-anchoring transpeptidase ErfK/SrfK